MDGGYWDISNIKTETCDLPRQPFDAFASFPLVSLSARLPCLSGSAIQAAFCFDCLPPGLIQSHTTSETEIISCSGSYGSTGSRAKSVPLFWAVFGSEVFPTFKRREERTAWCCSLDSAGLNKSCVLWKARCYSLSWAVKGPSVLLRLFVCFRGSITCIYRDFEVLHSTV